MGSHTIKHINTNTHHHHKYYHTTTTMKTVLLLLTLACVTAFVSARSRYLPLEPKEPELSCDLSQLLACTIEIEQAYGDCKHLSHTEEILKCIEDVLSAGDCFDCVCDLLPIC